MKDSSNVIKFKDGDSGNEKYIDRYVIEVASNGFFLQIFFTEGTYISEIYPSLDEVLQSISGYGC